MSVNRTEELVDVESQPEGQEYSPGNAANDMDSEHREDDEEEEEPECDEREEIEIEDEGAAEEREKEGDFVAMNTGQSFGDIPQTRNSGTEGATQFTKETFAAKD